MAVTKSLTTVIGQGVSVEIREATTGTYETVGYTKDKSKLKSDPLKQTIEKGLVKQLGHKITYSVDIVQFEESVLTLLEGFRDKLVDVKLTGAKNIVTLSGFSVSTSIDTTFSHEDLTAFNLMLERHCDKILDCVDIAAAP